MVYGTPASGVFFSLVQASSGLFYTTWGTQTTSASVGLAATGKVITKFPQDSDASFKIQTHLGYLFGWAGNTTGAPLIQSDLSGNSKVLYTATAADGMIYGDVILAADGNLYGQGRQSDGTGYVYKLTPNGTFSTLATYPDGLTQLYPGIIQASNGKLYGTSGYGGAHGAGMIFEVTLDGTLTPIYNFPNQATGLPSQLVEASDGNIYVVALGTYLFVPGYSSILQVNTATGAVSDIYQFKNPELGMSPAQLLEGSDGLIYGICANGGVTGNGLIFSLDLGIKPPLPKLQGIDPARPAPGATVLLYGNNLLGTSAVTFGGIPATNVTNVSVNYVRAQIPAGAASGNVELTTPNGTATFTIP